MKNPTTVPQHHRRLVELSHRPNATNYQIVEQAHNTWMDFVDANPVSPSLRIEQADFTSATSGILNKIFGDYLVANVQQKNPAYGMFPKYRPGPGVTYAFRAKSALGSSAKGGQTEGVVPTAVTATIKEISPTIKEHSTQVRVSGMQQDLAEGPDDAWGRLTTVVTELGIEHGREFERAILEDIDTTSGVHIESVDRATASSTNQAAIGWTAADEDIHGVDRSVDTYFNSNQTAAATAATLTLKQIDTQLRTVYSKEGRTNVILTGWDTWEAIADLVESRGRFDMSVNVAAGGRVGETDAAPGTTISTMVGSYQGIPILCSDLIQADSNEIGRMYGLDITAPDGSMQPKIGVALLRGTQVYLAGERSGTTPQSIGFVGDSALAVTRHELIVRAPFHQWQIRDRTAP